VLVGEHNLEVIQAADWVIDMGPEAGDGGGRIVAEGPPEDIVIHAARWTTAHARGGLDEGLLRSHTGEALAAVAATGRQPALSTISQPPPASGRVKRMSSVRK